jgi:hypothetical protein
MSQILNDRDLSPINGLPAYRSYFPPFQQVLQILGISRLDLNAKQVKVSTSGLIYLLTGVLNQVHVDEEWYTTKYPDVHAAVLSGDTPSAATHFRETGYLEGRLPFRLPFDPQFYFEQYKDLATVFHRDDEEALENHYQTKGYHEGRAGIREHFRQAEEWRVSAQKG